MLQEAHGRQRIHAFTHTHARWTIAWLLCVALATVGVACTSGLPMMPEERSPSGKYTMVVSIRKVRAGGEELIITVLDQEQRRTAIDYAFAEGHRTVFAWDDSDRLWIYSSDVGTYAYALRGNAWQRISEEEARAARRPEAIETVSTR